LIKRILRNSFNLPHPYLLRKSDLSKGEVKVETLGQTPSNSLD